MMNIDNKKLVPVFAILAALLIGTSLWQNGSTIWELFNSQESFRMYAIIAALVSSAITVVYVAMLWRIFFVAQDHLLRKLTLAVIVLSIIPPLLATIVASKIESRYGVAQKIDAGLNVLEQQATAPSEVLDTEIQETIEDINSPI